MGADMPADTITDQTEHVLLGIRCDECGGEGSVHTGRRGTRSRRCPMCHGEGELVARLTMMDFRSLVTPALASWHFDIGFEAALAGDDRGHSDSNGNCFEPEGRLQ